MKIFKYSVGMQTGPQSILMHGDNGRPIHFGEQGGQLFIWMEVVETLPLTYNNYWLAFTGDAVPGEAAHVGTVQVGALVWHLYRVGGGG